MAAGGDRHGGNPKHKELAVPFHALDVSKKGQRKPVMFAVGGELPGPGSSRSGAVPSGPAAAAPCRGARFTLQPHGSALDPCTRLRL